MDNFEKYVGQVLDKRYKLNRVIGIGGMAVVFEAHDLARKRVVAVKMIKDEIAGEAQTVKRFINESKAVSMLSHPNIVNIYDVSVRDDLKYIVMEYVAGITLKKYMEKKGALSFKETISYAEQILRALEHAHSKGIIHRDIKPQNIMLLKNGRIKVTDFGIAKLPNAETVTMTDKAIGTVYYISPEQASGKPIDRRSDLYSLGVMLYEMSTGTLPFNAENPVSVALMQVNDKPRRPRELNPSIPIGLEQIILGAMEKNPEYRFQSAGQMLRHIEQLKSNPQFIFKTKRDAPPTSIEPATGTFSKVSGDKPGAKANAKKPEKKPRKRSESRSMMPIIAGVTAAFLVVLGISGVYLLDAFLQSERAASPDIISVPDLTGETIDSDAVKNLDEQIFIVEIEHQYSDTYPRGTIISQDPAGGEKRKVKAGEQFCTITLTVSAGIETVILPDYTGRDNREVEMEIRALGLIPEARYEFSVGVERGLVIRTEPKPRTEMKIGETVVYYISRGQEDRGKVSVPNFVGMTAAAAYQMMVGENPSDPLLSLGTVTYEQSETMPKGVIISQSLDPEGEQVPRGAKINFVVSSGSPQTSSIFTDEPGEAESESKNNGNNNEGKNNNGRNNNGKKNRRDSGDD
ncbi:MAG: Stk1 family PASTA domain-containing Ser/Thr kinase [Clostridiales bacterium]|jgi:serine/threonine-protein kinase|nr:Stk1 family PASTA domain-containing Ser/Thr kinase [Clostridiales bacterium]